MDRMAEHKISIHLRNMIRCLEFLMVYSGFPHNQTYEPFCVFNENEYRVYNEMHITKW